MRFGTGLIVGKFCPLHIGHQFLIEKALAACDRLVIISYAKPDYPHCSTDNRERWLKTLYPNATIFVLDDDRVAAYGSDIWKTVPNDDAPDITHRQFTAWACYNCLGEVPDAIFTSEDYGDGFAVALGDYVSEREGQLHTITHISVDPDRTAHPISGTLIRQNPAAFRAFLPDIVYASFIRRAVFLGGESTGKTTLCRAMAAHLSTQWAPEYGREIWIEKNGQLVFEDLLHIAQVQIARENRLAAQSTNWLFCDTSPLTTAFYSEALFDNVDPSLWELADRKYDVMFLCDADIAFEQDGHRADAAFRQTQQDWYRAQLKARNIPYTVLNGSLDTRIATVLDALKTLD